MVPVEKERLAYLNLVGVYSFIVFSFLSRTDMPLNTTFRERSESITVANMLLSKAIPFFKTFDPSVSQTGMHTQLHY